MSRNEFVFLKIQMTTTMTPSSKLILASMAMAVVSVLMLLDWANLVVSVNLAV